MARVKYFLKALFNARCWLRNYKMSRTWDVELRKAMHERIIIQDVCTAKVGEHTIWIANHPYADGHSYVRNKPQTHMLPSRTTVMELRDLLQKNILVQVLDGSLPAHFKLDR